MDNIVEAVYGFAKITTFIFLMGFPFLVVRRMNNRKQRKTEKSERFKELQSAIDDKQNNRNESEQPGKVIQNWFSRRRIQFRSKSNAKNDWPHL